MYLKKFKNGPKQQTPNNTIKNKFLPTNINYGDKPLGTTSPDFEPSFVGRVEASSSMFTSSKLAWSKELSAAMGSLMEVKSTLRKALMASWQKSSKPTT